MRLFVAADISDDTRREFRRVREQLEPRLAAARVPPRLVWVADEAAHVTLRFIGQAADDQVARIESALAIPIEQAAFALSWRTLGTFPSGRSPRVVWLGTSDEVAPSRGLAAIVNARLDPIVGAAEDRPYTPHVTLARVKDPGRGVEWSKALAGVAVEPTVSRVEHITLYESRVTSRGSTYTVRMRTPLA
jgi:RNA 2',3'-cyclic 3'-phosphodiesterase